MTITGSHSAPDIVFGLDPLKAHFLCFTFDFQCVLIVVDDDHALVGSVERPVAVALTRR